MISWKCFLLIWLILISCIVCTFNTGAIYEQRGLFGIEKGMLLSLTITIISIGIVVLVNSVDIMWISIISILSVVSPLPLAAVL
jgi:hypothetical protein